MPDLGKAYVQIVPSADGVSGSISGLLGGEAMAAGTSSGRLFSGSFGKAAAALGGAAVVKKGLDFLKDSVQTGMEFDTAMSQVAATMGTTVDQIGDLRDAARQAGRNTVFSAQESAQALNYMALAGYDAETSMEMLPNVLNLAAAGSMDLAQASDMITDSQSALNLSLDDTSQLVDKMAKAASKSNTSVAQLGEAILTVGGTANFMAGGTTELATVLGILADNGYKGAEGGTHLRNMLLSLTDPTDAARDTMANLGVSIFDAEGNMRAFADFFPELQAALSNLTSEEQIAALGNIFNTRDMATAQALLSTTTERWNELGGAIDASAGAAQKMADTQTDNLQGDLIELKNKWDDLKISIADGAEPAARGFVQSVTEALDGVMGFFDEYAPQFSAAAQVDADAIAGTFYESTGPMGEAMQSALSGAVSAASDGSLFLDAGLNATASFGEGASSGMEAQEEAFRNFGTAVAEAFGFAIDEQTGPISDKAKAMADGAGDPLDALAGSATGWGSHMGANFAAGLASQVGPVGAAAAQVAAAAAVPLKHTVPKDGPLSDDDQWGAHLVQNLISGMERESPNLRRSSDRLAGIVSGSMGFDARATRSVQQAYGSGSGGESGLSGEIRRLSAAIRSMGIYLDSGLLVGTVNQGLGQTKVDQERRTIA